MTADADLTEQIARALTEALYGADVEERTRRVLPDQADRLFALYHQQSTEYAAAVLPIIRQAQRDAWDEGQVSGWRSAQEESQMNGMVGDIYDLHTETGPNPYDCEETP